jgi:diadenylate cyclase
VNALNDKHLLSEEATIKPQLEELKSRVTQLLENIFYPGSPLHDGAVIIRDSKIRKTSVLLPLAPHTPELEALGLGSRHRAGLGLSQVSDALIIVVFEEKGWITMAFRGQLYPNLGTFALLEKLENSIDEENQ